MFVERPLFPPFKLRNCGADARYKRDDWPIVPWPMAPAKGADQGRGTEHSEQHRQAARLA